MEPLTNILEDQKEISFSKTKLLFMLLFLVIMTLACPFSALLYFTDSNTPNIVATIIFSIGILVLLIFFGYLTARIFLKLQDNRPVFTISKIGIHWEETGDEVLWSDVMEITTAEFKGFFFTEKKEVHGHLPDRPKSRLLY